MRSLADAEALLKYIQIGCRFDGRSEREEYFDKKITEYFTEKSLTDKEIIQEIREAIQDNEIKLPGVTRETE